MTEDQITGWFRYRSPNDKQVEAMARWREDLTNVAVDFANNTPMSGDVIVALRALKTAMMAMNSALVSPMPK